MKQYEMPYSFIFIRCVEERHSLVITDSEVHAGAHCRARAILAEAQRRESLQGNALMPRLEQ